MGVAALVLGIICVVLCWIPFVNWVGIGLGVLGILFGALGMGKANRNNGQGKGVAVAGLVLSIIGVAIAVLAWTACLS